MAIVGGPGPKHNGCLVAVVVAGMASGLGILGVSWAVNGAQIAPGPIATALMAVLVAALLQTAGELDTIREKLKDMPADIFFYTRAFNEAFASGARSAVIALNAIIFAALLGTTLSAPSIQSWRTGTPPSTVTITATGIPTPLVPTLPPWSGCLAVLPCTGGAATYVLMRRASRRGNAEPV